MFKNFILNNSYNTQFVHLMPKIIYKIKNSMTEHFNQTFLSESETIFHCNAMALTNELIFFYPQQSWEIINYYKPKYLGIPFVFLLFIDGGLLSKYYSISHGIWKQMDKLIFKTLIQMKLQWRRYKNIPVVNEKRSESRICEYYSVRNRIFNNFCCIAKKNRIINWN